MSQKGVNIIMKKKSLIFLSVGLIILLIIWGYSSVSKYKNYSQRGVPLVKGLVGGAEAWYNQNIFADLSTIATNSEYGTFVFRKNGEFSYFPNSKDILINKSSKTSRYDGFWFMPDYYIRLTVIRKYMNRNLLNISFKDEEFFLFMRFNWPSDMSFNDNLIINGQEFVLLNNDLTKNNKEKLRMEDETIEKFLKEK